MIGLLPRDSTPITRGLLANRDGTHLRMSLVTSISLTSSPAGLASSWHDNAACRGLAAEIFFPQDEEGVDAARSVCGECPVREDCLEYSLAVREKDGVWGGFTERERRSLIRRRRRAAAKVRAAIAVS